jgi:hypothetical protein
VEAQARAQPDRWDALQRAADSFDARMAAYFTNPAIPDAQKAERVAYLIGFMARRRDEETMLRILSGMGFPDPAAALAQGIAFYQEREGGCRRLTD